MHPFDISNVLALSFTIPTLTMKAARACLFFALFTSLLLYSLGSRLVYHNDASQPDELDLMELIIGEPSAVKRSRQDQKGATTGLWFGPRLGRRKRAVGSRERREIDDTGLQVNEEVIEKLIQDEPWALVAFRGGKRRSTNFTPRLGRNSEEEIYDNFMEPMYGRTPTRSGGGGGGSSGDATATHFGPNFTPRLGRLAPLSH